MGTKGLPRESDQFGKPKKKESSEAFRSTSNRITNRFSYNRGGMVVLREKQNNAGNI